jgi:hypothetical protein
MAHPPRGTRTEVPLMRLDLATRLTTVAVATLSILLFS